MKKSSDKNETDVLIKKIIREVIRKDCRKEANEIMLMADEKQRNEIIEYYKKESFNVVCMVVDFAKWQLIKQGKMKHKKSDHFGHPWVDGIE